LRGQRLVEAKVAGNGRPGGSVGALAGHHGYGVAGQRLEQQEHHHHHAQQYQQAVHQTANDEFDHKLSGDEKKPQNRSAAAKNVSRKLGRSNHKKRTEWP
jgi:hypothetical protein